jgi:AhpD family alkylhydroperoxidase
MFANNNFVRRTTAALAFGLAAAVALPALAVDNTRPTADEIYKEIESTFGGLPSFIKALPKAAVAGAWLEERDLEMSETTALDPKTKALISLAVAAQIPCHYCIWADTKSAKQFGATDEEIAEAVTMAALTRHWSTIFNGMQIDFETFKQELGGE